MGKRASASCTAAAAAAVVEEKPPKKRVVPKSGAATQKGSNAKQTQNTGKTQKAAPQQSESPAKLQRAVPFCESPGYTPTDTFLKEVEHEMVGASPSHVAAECTGLRGDATPEGSKRSDTQVSETLLESPPHEPLQAETGLPDTMTLSPGEVPQTQFDANFGGGENDDKQDALAVNAPPLTYEQEELGNSDVHGGEEQPDQARASVSIPVAAFAMKLKNMPSLVLDDAQRTPQAAPIEDAQMYAAMDSSPLTNDEIFGRTPGTDFGSERTPEPHGSASTSQMWNSQESSLNTPRQQRDIVANKTTGLAAVPVNPICVKCAFPTEALNSICKSKATATQHAKFICRPCNRVISMLNRNVKLDGPLAMNAWTPQQRLDFWRDACKCTDESGRMVYGQIRGLLKKECITRKVEESKTVVCDDFRPLSVWEKQGYDVTMIVNYDQKEWNPAIGWTYGVPLKSITWSSAEVSIEETLMQAERAVRQKKGDNSELQELPIADESQDELDGPKPQAAGRSSAHEAAAAGRKADKDAEKEKLKEHGQTIKHNNKVQILASKTVTGLTGHRDILEKIKKGKSWTAAPDFVSEKVESAVNTAKEYISAADQVLAKLKKCSKDGSKLPDLDFSLTDLNQCVKNMKQAASDFKDFEKLYMRQ